MTVTFKEIFDNDASITEQEVEFCKSYFEFITLPKNYIVEEDNNIPKYLYFITEGYVRLFYYDENGDEHTNFIASPNNFITSFLDFIHQKTTNQNLECITDCQFFRIERSKLAELIDKNTTFKKISLTIFENAFSISNSRANDLATLSAELRYKKLLKQEPLIIQNVPVQYIASYLGIKPQSLSRIRKQIIK